MIESTKKLKAVEAVEVSKETNPDADPLIVRGVLDFPSECPPERVLLGNGWLRRGETSTMISSAGSGKSVGITQAAMAWALGLPYFGIAPVRPLRVLLLSGEDDDVTIGEIREGFLEHSEATTGRKLVREDLRPLDEYLRTDFSRKHVGLPFFSERLRPMLEDEPADLVLVNPMLSFVGGDIVQAASDWLRVGLGPLLQEFDAAAIVVSHTPKLSKDGWEGTDSTYSAIGGSEMANVPRAVLTLRPTKGDGLWALTVSKRQTTGWTNEDGDFVSVYYVRRSGDPSRPAWLPVPFHAAEVELANSTGRKITVADVEADLETGPMQRKDLLAGLQQKCGVGETAAKNALKEARESNPPRIVVTSEEPNPKGGRKLVWLGLPNHKGQK